MKPANEGKTYILIAALIIGLTIFGIIPLSVRFITQTILGNPAVDTSGMAAVNIATMLSMVVSLIVAMTFAVIGIIKNIKFTKNKK